MATQGPLSWLVPCGAAAPSVRISHTYFSGLLSSLDEQERDGLPDLLENFCFVFSELRKEVDLEFRR